MKAEQLGLSLIPDWQTCQHAGFYTNAEVPGGFFCGECRRIIWRSVPQPPELVGYLTADWAWKHKYGRAWTIDSGEAHP